MSWPTWSGRICSAQTRQRRCRNEASFRDQGTIDDVGAVMLAFLTSKAVDADMESGSMAMPDANDRVTSMRVSRLAYIFSRRLRRLSGMMYLYTARPKRSESSAGDPGRWTGAK